MNSAIFTCYFIYDIFANLLMKGNSMKFRYLSILGIFAVLLTSTELNAKKSAFRTYGDVFQIVIPVSALATALFKEDYDGCWQLAKSFTTTMVVTGLLKLAIYRKRPTGNGKHSFPSGHTAAAFSGAGFYGQRYGLAYGAPSYVAAAAVGGSRIHAKAHRWDEVIAGALIGILPNLYFTTSYVEHKSMDKKVDDSSKTNHEDKPLEPTALPK